jgi:starvation-inducible outer membrane lipoprotein
VEKEVFPMRIIIAVALVLMATACSKAAADIKEAAKQADCAAVEYYNEPNAFHGTSARCADSAVVYWFPTAEANKDHGEVCKQVGGRQIASGNNWTKYLPSC